MNDKDVRRGAGIYSKPILSVYDLLVVKMSNSWAWHCPSQRMLAAYKAYMGHRHLDVGPGTGWFLARSITPSTDLWLMDLNRNSLESAAARLNHTTAISSLEHNVLEPLPANITKFDSIGINYVAHCLPGTWQEKGKAFSNLADLLDDDGYLFGSTILGDGVEHNLAGTGLMKLYNRLGIFHNVDDDLDGLRQALTRAFDDVEVDLVGTVAVFNARGPRRQITDPA